MSEPTGSSSPDASPQLLKRWTTQQIFVLFSPADGDEWYRAKDVDAAPPLRSDGGADLTVKELQLLASVLTDVAENAITSEESDVREEAPMLRALSRKLSILASRSDGGACTPTVHIFRDDSGWCDCGLTSMRADGGAQPDLPAEKITLDEQYLHHLREAAYDWAIAPLKGEEPRNGRTAAVVLARNALSLIDEVRRLRASDGGSLPDLPTEKP